MYLAATPTYMYVLVHSRMVGCSGVMQGRQSFTLHQHSTMTHGLGHLAQHRAPLHCTTLHWAPMAGECWSHVVMVAADSNSSPEPSGWDWPGNKGQLKTYHLASSLLPAALLSHYMYSCCHLLPCLP